MHFELDALGVVARILTILAHHPRVAVDPTKVLCWVALDPEGDHRVTIIRVMYSYRPKSLRGKVQANRASQVGRAEFRVQEGRPFGRVTDEPLSQEVVSAVHKMANRYGN